MVRSLALYVMLALVLVACGGDSSPTESGGPNGPIITANGWMSATINGSPWSAQFITPVIGQSGHVWTIGGSGANGTTVSFAWMDNGGSTYTVGDPNSVGFNSVVAIAGQGYQAGPANLGIGGSGTMTITSITANRITGTFSFTLVRAQGEPGAGASITNGQFDITY
ncbi:MAG: DUF6252 family protein [Gemmatimonadota bacterium]